MSEDASMVDYAEMIASIVREQSVEVDFVNKIAVAILGRENDLSVAELKERILRFVK